MTDQDPRIWQYDAAMRVHVYGNDEAHVVKCNRMYNWSTEDCVGSCKTLKDARDTAYARLHEPVPRGIKCVLCGTIVAGTVTWCGAPSYGWQRSLPGNHYMICGPDELGVGFLSVHVCDACYEEDHIPRAHLTFTYDRKAAPP